MNVKQNADGSFTVEGRGSLSQALEAVASRLNQAAAVKRRVAEVTGKALPPTERVKLLDVESRAEAFKQAAERRRGMSSLERKTVSVPPSITGS